MNSVGQMSIGSTTSRSLSRFLRTPSSSAPHVFLHKRGSQFAKTSVQGAIVRSMATAGTGKKFEWLVILPDHDGAIEKRLAVRSKHLENILPQHQRNRVIWGGAMFSHPPAEGETPPPMVGSALLVYAETKEEVLELVKSDVYVSGGVWDLSKMQIWPFKSAVRSDLSATTEK